MREAPLPPIDVVINTRADPLTTLNPIPPRDGRKDLLKTVTCLNSLKGLLAQVPSRAPGSVATNWRLFFYAYLIYCLSHDTYERVSRCVFFLFSFFHVELSRLDQCGEPPDVLFFYIYLKRPLCLARLCDATERLWPSSLLTAHPSLIHHSRF